MTRERRDDNSEWPEWLHRAWNLARNEPGALRVSYVGHIPSDELEITTPEGVQHITWDDWIIQGVHGELYPCKPNIFAATYELALE